MLKKENANRLLAELDRIFAISIGRTTFREVQNIILDAVEHDTQLANRLLESFLRKDLQDSLAEADALPFLKRAIDTYYVRVRMAREVFERGDFIHVITSDTAHRQGHSLLMNRIRLVCGQETEFISDTESTLQIVHHFLTRLDEISTNQEAVEELSKYKEHLMDLRNRLSQILDRTAGS